MTDKDIILNYINNYYVFHYEEHETNIVRNAILGVQNKSTKSFTSFRGIIDELKLLYGDFIFENGDMIEDCVSDWFEEEKNKCFKEIYDRLSELRVELGETNWVVIDKDNQPFSFGDLEPLSVKYQSIKIVEEIYGEWFDNQVATISEQIMGVNL